MKRIKVLLVVTFSALTLLYSCKDNDSLYEKKESTDLKITTAFLKQTGWEGVYTNKKPEGTETTRMKILFTTENRGSSVEYYGERFYEYSFNYAIDSNLVTISNYGMLNGDWLAVEKNSEKLVLKRGLTGTSLLELRRVY